MSTANRETLASFNPASGELVGEIPTTSIEEIPGLIARARRAQISWGRLSLSQRGDQLIAAGEHLLGLAEEIGTLLTHEMGKPLKDGIGEVQGCAEGISDSVREIAEALEPETLEEDRARSVIYHDPLGVCAAITPWNFPVAMPHWLVLPALMAGNAVILKPSEETPLVAQAYVDALNRALPADLLLTVHGADAQGKALVQSDVELIAFTGSRETGKKILTEAASSLKRVILELGGKDPLIVLRDADLEAAAKFASMNSFRNAGQVCISTERIYVAAEVAQAFEAHLVGFAKELQVGPGTRDGVRIGPMIHDRQRAQVLRQIDDAIENGARIALGGKEHPDRFIQPTILSDLDETMEIMREETFGPVACIQTFRDPEDAIRMANGTPFGLGAVVFGRDETRTNEVARRLDAGMVGINRGCGGVSGSPWVGAKESGYGFHGSRDGHRQFTQTRVVSSTQ